MRGLVFRVGGVALAATFASCLDPTEIEIVISTDLACGAVAQHGVAVAVGAPGDDSVAASANTHDCDDGGLGTLVVLPGRGIGDVVGIRVMMGVDASVEDCDEAHAFAGCIVARRTLGFVPHHPLTLPIELQAACVGKVCDPSSTCFNGSCVDAGATCDGSTCDLGDAAGPPPPPVCKPFGPTPVTTDALANTPHIARLPNGGWLVAWVGAAAPSKTLYIAHVDAAGSVDPPHAVTTLATSVGVTGPLGTDGDSLLTFFYDQTTSPLSVIGASLDAGSASLSTTGVPPLDGVHRLGGGLYEALFTYGTSTQIFTIDANKALVGPGTTPALDLTNTAGLGFARAGVTTFISYAHTTDTSCHVATCVSGGSCSEVLNYGNCPVIRTTVASASSWASVGLVSGTPRLAVHSPSISDVAIVTTPAQPSAGIPLVTVDDAYAFVRDASESIGRADTANPTPVKIASTPGYGSAGGLGAGFDVVADDPATSRAYAMVVWSSSSVQITHVCP